MNTDRQFEIQLQSALRRLAIQTVVVFVVAFLALLLSAVLLQAFHSRQIARVVSDSVRHNLVIGDLREAMVVLEKATQHDFMAIQYLRSAGTNAQTFTVPSPGAANLFLKPSWNLASISYAVNLSERSEKGDNAQLTFLYEKYSLVGKLLLFGSILIILGLLPVLFIGSRRVRAKVEAALDHSKAIARVQLAEQVSHDLRSPISLLKALQYSSSELPKEPAELLGLAVSRIQAILENLSPVSPQVDSTNVTIAEISETIANLIRTKQIEFGPKISISLKNLTGKSDDLRLIEGSLPQFERILSNLINNAYEACPTKPARILVALARVQSNLEIKITDTGTGIPEEILSRIGTRGFTFGKVDGSGLGLSHAKTTIESWGGQLTICSKVGSGTEVLISLPTV